MSDVLVQLEPLARMVCKLHKTKLPLDKWDALALQIEMHQARKLLELSADLLISGQQLLPWHSLAILQHIQLAGDALEKGDDELYVQLAIEYIVDQMAYAACMHKPAVPTTATAAAVTRTAATYSDLRSPTFVIWKQNNITALNVLRNQCLCTLPALDIVLSPKAAALVAEEFTHFKRQLSHIDFQATDATLVVEGKPTWISASQELVTQIGEIYREDAAEQATALDQLVGAYVDVDMAQASDEHTSDADSPMSSDDDTWQSSSTGITTPELPSIVLTDTECTDRSGVLFAAAASNDEDEEMASENDVHPRT